MTYPEITHLYLYRPANEYTLKIFANERLWASKPNNFNDPFDCDLEISKGVTEEDVTNAILSSYGEKQKWPSAIRQFMDSSFDESGKFTESKRKQIDEAVREESTKNGSSGFPVVF